MTQLIAIIDNNSTSDIRVRIHKLHGRRHVSVVEFVDFDADSRQPTTRIGIGFRPTQLVAVIRALQDAEEVLRTNGFLKGDAA